MTSDLIPIYMHNRQGLMHAMLQVIYARQNTMNSKFLQSSFMTKIIVPEITRSKNVYKRLKVQKNQDYPQAHPQTE